MKTTRARFARQRDVAALEFEGVKAARSHGAVTEADDDATRVVYPRSSAYRHAIAIEEGQAQALVRGQPDRWEYDDVSGHSLRLDRGSRDAKGA